MSILAKKCVLPSAVGLSRPRIVPGICSGRGHQPRLAIVSRAGPDDQSKEQAPIKLPETDMPPWIRREQERKLQASAPKGVPWGLFLLFSCFTAIAAVGSIFEYTAGNAIFGVIQPDSPVWAPILLCFAVTGLPMSGFLFLKGVEGFNDEADRQNKMDGYSE